MIPRGIAVCLVAIAGLAAPAAADPRALEIDLRESTYLFGVPAGSLGPYDSEKLDITAAGAADTAFLHVVNTNRIDPSGGGHGEFVRIEDDRRIGASTLRVAAGTGAGVLGERSFTLALAQPISADRHVALSAAVDLTSLSPQIFQRVVGVGPELRVGAISVYARYYHATTTTGSGAPSSASVLAGAPLSRRFAVSIAANFGGELNADRTSGFLPTSSGRFGTDLSAAVHAGLGRNAGVLAAYDGAVYRGPPAGAVSRIQHIITIGAFAQTGRR